MRRGEQLARPRRGGARGARSGARARPRAPGRARRGRRGSPARRPRPCAPRPCRRCAAAARLRERARPGRWRPPPRPSRGAAGRSGTGRNGGGAGACTYHGRACAGCRTRCSTGSATTARDLPWRRTRDPYAILVSEVMLQQTQVARVLERYEPWLERWPTPAALAAAPAADVLRAWSGLGYNRRALNLQNAARRVVELGGFPRDIAGLERLPGSRPVHRARDRLLRLRRPGDGARHERAARARALARHDGRRAARRAGLGLEPGALRPRRAGLPGARPALRALPAGRARARRAAGRSRRCAARAASRARAASAAPRSCASSQTGPRADGGYDRDVVDSLLADGLAVRRADGLLALPEELPRVVSIPRYADERGRAASPCKPGASASRPRRRAVRGVGARPCDAALAAGRAPPPRCVVVPDAARPLLGPYEPLVASLGRDRRGLLLVHAHPRRRVRGLPQAALPPRARRTGTRIAFGGRMDRSILEHEMAADYGARARAHRRASAARLTGCAARPRDDAGRHRLHVRRDGARVEARRRRARPPGRVRQPARRARSSSRRSRRAPTACA